MSGALKVIQLLPALHGGGVERSTLEIAAALVADGHRSVVVSAGGRLVAPLLAAGSEHITLDIGRKSLRTLTRVGALRRLIAEQAPDLVHARSRLPAWMARLALRGLPAPAPHFVTTVHGLNSPGRYSAVMTSGERVICVSRTVADYVTRHYPGVPADRLRVIRRGVNPNDFPRDFTPSQDWLDRFRAEFPALQGGCLLCLPGRGSRGKGHADAIDLLAGLRQGGIDARLLLLGIVDSASDGYVDELQQMACALSVKSALVMTPMRDDVREVLATSSLVLQLSRKPEALGRTVIEALSLGRPVLGYDHGGVGELLREYFPEGRATCGNLNALIAAAQRLLAARTVPADLPLPTLQAMQADTLRLYRELVDG